MEMKSDSKYNLSEWTIQEYLSLGYVYLLILGLISDAIFYGFLRINIVRYSSVFDILQSPIATITDRWIVPLAIAVVMLIAYWMSIWAPKFHTKYREKKWYRFLHNVEKLDKRFATSKSAEMTLRFAAVAIFSFFLGTGIGSGFKTSEQIKKGDIKKSHRIIFKDNEQLDIKLIGQNSQYIFYLSGNSKQLSISPIQDNIKKMTKLNTDK